MGRINVILFDWDGTIAETLDVWLHTPKEAYAKVGVYI
jgi:beta-phosphoglucomutase-like phosphatase (HAD superfamily)